MPITRTDDGTWVMEVGPDDQSHLSESHASYWEAVPRYLTALDPAFLKARERCEFEFLLSLFRVRGIQGPGWDPWETTQKAIPALLEAHREIKDFYAKRHLQLWIYGHILEASEQYEFLANLIGVADGGRYHMDRFPPKHRRPQSPGEKISQLENAAREAELSGVTAPLREIWNRDLRNAIFHADYVLHGGDVRTLRPTHSYRHDEILTYVNRAVAYHHALGHLFQSHIASYQEPKIINVHPEFSRHPLERAVVIVRKGHGAVGLKHAWTAEQINAGAIRWQMGIFFAEEMKLLDADPTLASLPESPKSARPEEDDSLG